MTLKNNEKIYDITSTTVTIILFIAIILLLIYLIAPLFNGKFFVNAIIKCASWIGIALAIKIVLNRVKKGLHIRGRDYLLFFLFFTINLAVWFPYPSNLIFIILGVIGLSVSYRANKHSKDIQEKRRPS